jgi:hypothetical protein
MFNENEKLAQELEVK